MSTQERSVVLEGRTYLYTLRKSRQAKNILLHVADDGSIEAVVPLRASFRAAEQFVHEQREWLRKVLTKKEAARRKAPQRRLVTGELLPVLGDVRRLHVDIDRDRRRTRWREVGDEIHVHVPRRHDVRPVLVRWYHQRARAYMEQRAKVMAELLGVQVKTVAISNARTQWGSCIAEKSRLSFQWRLVLGPLDVADYVIAHEVAHLAERGHTDRFWRLVEQLQPGYQDHRMWLRQRGQQMVL